MTKPTPKATETYFENPDRKTDTDFVEVMNMNETYGDLMKESEQNPSDSKIDLNKKMEIMLEYRKRLFIDDLEKANQRSYIDLNKNVMNFCRDSCINVAFDNISDVEKNCIKNCSHKYLEQFYVYNTFKETYEKKFGTQIFLFDNKKKQTLNKLIDMVKMNQEASL